MTTMKPIYTGAFASVDGVRYRVEILSAETSRVPEEIAFSCDTPVEIEWREIDKLDPVQGSCLTLTLQSLKDRQFISLYVVKAGTIRADIYRNEALYWSGQLDTELYEEPYSYKSDYDVTFSFSDFAILDRAAWGNKRVCSIQEVIDTCVAEMKINCSGVVKHISTTHADDIAGKPVDLSELYVTGENFFDEEGKAKSMREVLEAVLQPFALRMVQKGGYLHLYDLNAAYNEMVSEQVWWKSDDAYLGVDVLYNNVKVTFSPYATAQLINADLDHDEVLPDQTTRKYWMDTDFDHAADGFRLAVGDQTNLPLRLSNGAKFYRIDSDYSGSDEAGVIFAYKGNDLSKYSDNLLNPFPRAVEQGKCVSVPILSTEQGFLGYAGASRTDFKLKISLDLLFDVRYNPFEGATRANEEGNFERLNNWCNFGYVPVMLYLKDRDGKILYHYENSRMIDTDTYRHDLVGWASGSGSWGDMYLCYYDWDNRKSASGFGGWKKNKPIIGYYRGDLPKKWKTVGEGEFINLPPATGGFLELQVGSGIFQFDYGREEKDIYSIARWLMYRSPSVTLVKSNGTAISLSDIEDEAWINRDAKEEKGIETILGTLKSACLPSARGLVMDRLLRAYSQFTRAGVTDRLERLLIGTVYSQYASRQSTLSGTVRLLPDMSLYTDASTDGRYILLSEVQDLMLDTSEIKMAELTEEEYAGIEEKS